MTYKDIMAFIGTGFSLTCLGLVVWMIWSGVRQANRVAAYRRKLDARLSELGQHVIVAGREERVN